MKHFKTFLLIIVICVCVMSISLESTFAATYSVPFRVVKDGSTETSRADQYFQKPAVVAIDGDHYVVILTIRTTHDLGLFPVSVTDFNGQTPVISRTTQGNTDYYQYKFTAADLNSRLNGHMNVNIQAIRYNHYYGYGVVFDTTQLPKIGEQHNTNSSSSIASSDNTASSESTNRSSSSSSSSDSTKKRTLQVIPHVSVSKKNHNKLESEKSRKFVLWPWMLVIGVGVTIVVIFERRSRG